MTKDELQAQISEAFADCKVRVDGGDGRFGVLLVGERFAEMSQLKRQQAVYAAIGEHISSGAVHAVSIKALTEAEFAAAQEGGDNAG